MYPLRLEGGLTHAHAIERARERYGVDLDACDLCAMVDAIRAGRAVLFERRNAAQVYAVKHGDVVMLAVYRGGWIVTFLPKDNATPAGRKRHALTKIGKTRTSRNRYKREWKRRARKKNREACHGPPG